MSLASSHSVFRERLFEHQLIFELMRHSWKHDQASLEVSQPAIDRSGHDLVLEARGITRHVQLKTSWTTARADSQNVHVGLGSKPSGCVLWMLVDEGSMECNTFLFFGGAPGEPLPSIFDLKIARHTRKNSSGNGERPNVREIRRSQFRRLVGVADVYQMLFGETSSI
jgi:hypothetical protein